MRTTRTSVLGALNVLELGRQLGCRVLHASTSEVYGGPLVHPQREDYWGHVNPTGLHACYDKGKRCAETLFFDYHCQYGVEVKVARIFNTYGPRILADDDRVVSNFFVQPLCNNPLTIYGDGSQTRSFCFVDDMMEGLTRLMLTLACVTGPINLGNAQEFTVLELARLVLELTGSRSRLVNVALPQDDPRQRRPDIAAAGRILGWQPRVDLREGLKSTIAAFERWLTLPTRVDASLPMLLLAGAAEAQ